MMCSPFATATAGGSLTIPAMPRERGRRQERRELLFDRLRKVARKLIKKDPVKFKRVLADAYGDYVERLYEDYGLGQRGAGSPSPGPAEDEEMVGTDALADTSPAGTSSPSPSRFCSVGTERGASGGVGTEFADEERWAHAVELRSRHGDDDEDGDEGAEAHGDCASEPPAAQDDSGLRPEKAEKGRK